MYFESLILEQTVMAHVPILHVKKKGKLGSGGREKVGNQTNLCCLYFLVHLLSGLFLKTDPK